ncbi:hypothetical protein [Ruminiclostridium josui]|uniref:hypothetical protein n=1 Tax=Ruminiclostridium josui TaxID=1499 RepID=UPI000ABF8EB8|nr:hypothetical protein [Ruminiclostridium josui]
MKRIMYNATKLIVFFAMILVNVILPNIALADKMENFLLIIKFRRLKSISVKQ